MSRSTGAPLVFHSGLCSASPGQIGRILDEQPCAGAKLLGERHGQRRAEPPRGHALLLQQGFDRGQVQLFSKNAFTEMFPEIAIPSLPLMGAYALRVQSLADSEALLRHEGMTMRRLGAALVVPFPGELGAGAWLFVENAAHLPWRS